MIHIIEGDGKGKTSAAIGISMRAAGHGFPVLFIQFLKDDGSGEISVMKSIPEVTICHAPVNYGLTFQMTKQQLEKTAKECDKLMNIAIESEDYLIILDEVIDALNVGLVDKGKLEQMLQKDKEIVLTGRDAPKWLIEKAQYVSNIQKIKHPYDNGVIARKGIEY